MKRVYVFNFSDDESADNVKATALNLRKLENKLRPVEKRERLRTLKTLFVTELSAINLHVE